MRERHRASRDRPLIIIIVILNVPVAQSFMAVIKVIDRSIFSRTLLNILYKPDYFRASFLMLSQKK